MSVLTWLKEKTFWFFGFQKINGITIEHSAVQDLCQIARDAHPKEMLAFLSASKGNNKGHIHIDEIQLQAYTAGESSALVNLHMLPTFSNILGTVHSHPGGSRRPSSADRNLWQNYGFVHAIIGEPYTPSHITFFDKEANIINVAMTHNVRKNLKKAKFRKV